MVIIIIGVTTGIGVVTVIPIVIVIPTMVIMGTGTYDISRIRETPKVQRLGFTGNLWNEDNKHQENIQHPIGSKKLRKI